MNSEQLAFEVVELNASLEGIIERLRTLRRAALQPMQDATRDEPESRGRYISLAITDIHSAQNWLMRMVSEQ